MDIGPDGKGDWNPVAYERLKEVGAWMDVNSSGIYDTHLVAPYNEDNLFFTQRKEGCVSYAFYVLGNGSNRPSVGTNFATIYVLSDSKVYMLGY